MTYIPFLALLGGSVVGTAAEGIINGINGALQPQACATRAQIASIFHRFCENIVE